MDFVKEIQLTDNTSIKIYEARKEILDYILNNFENIFNLHPVNPNNEKSKIMLYNKNINKPDWNELIVNRWYNSYLKTPLFNKQYKKSYMFSGEDKKEILNDIPDIIKPLYECILSIDNRYNQVVINWYEKENDYIALHSDWNDGMIDNYNIGVMSLYGINDKIRNFEIVNKKTNEKIIIELTNGIFIQMCGDFQNEFRHRVPKISDNDIISKRVGISFRQYK